MKTPILQFGTSRFLQAHADLFVSEALKSGQALGPITVLQTTQASERSRRLAALAAPGGFAVRIRGKQDGAVIDQTVMVTSVKRAMSAVEDWALTERIFAEETRLVICNTADTGYDISGEHPALTEAVPPSFPGKLTKLLLRRHRSGAEPLTVLPAELVPQNGMVLKSIVLDLAEGWSLGNEFRDWLDGEVIFANTLVDRIVSEPLEPAGAVAEPYALWAIERQPEMTLPCDHPAIVVADDISRFANLKLFILNLGHTFMTDGWLHSDLPRDMTVRELLTRPQQREALLSLYESEVVPGFAKMALGTEASDYVKQTLERFDNPFLDHRVADIAQNHAEKIRRRAGGFLEWSGISAPRLEALVASVA